MTKKLLSIILTLIMIMNLPLTAYGDETTIQSLSINGGNRLYMSVDDYVTLDIKINSKTASADGITFSSSYPGIAEVDYKGNITAKRVGQTTISAEKGGKKSSITVVVSKIDNSIGVSYSVADVSGTKFKQITVTPRRYDDGELVTDNSEDEYYIYLPSGYFVVGKTASYVADKNGVYPFTIYYKNNKRTFYYTVKDIETSDSEDDEDEDEKSSDEIILDNSIQYDYEKKQVLFHMELDKTRTVTTPDKATKETNEINYYITSLKNNIPYDFSIKIDDKNYEYKVIKQGEFYLLVAILPINYDDYSTIVKYSGYNFTTNESFKAIPNRDIFYDNGNYEVLIQSPSNTKEIFNFSIDGIDYRRPSVEISVPDDNSMNLDIEDDFGLDYMITFDGKYVSLDKTKTKLTYNHKAAATYNGDYLFTVVDKAGNRTVATKTITNKTKPRKAAINYSVHNYKNTKDLFTNIGKEYFNDSDDSAVYEITFPAYMKGSNSYYFSPNSPMTRAEMITLFCRLTDLPYDPNAFLKNKFTDISYHWARDYISMGSAKKYISGYKDKTFRPDNYVTRAEFCEMLTKISAFKTMLTQLPATSNYDYKDTYGHWAQKKIATVVQRDLLTGTGSYFYPESPVTRGEVVHAINKLYSLNPSDGELKYIESLYKKYYNLSDIKYNKYYYDIIISLVGMYREKIN